VHAPTAYVLARLESAGKDKAALLSRFTREERMAVINRPDLLATDTGCVWGGCLTAVRVDGGRREFVQVHCEQAQRPG